MNKLIAILSGVFMLVASCSIGQNKNDIQIDEFQKKIATENYTLVDVRTVEEYADGHLEGALNIDYFSATFSEDIGKLGFETPVLVYCRSGNRSGKSMKIMYDLGFTEVKNLIGGYKGWVSKKQPTTKEQ
jgi:rhodanese-related sulfurtransferase